MELNEQKNSTV